MGLASCEPDLTDGIDIAEDQSQELVGSPFEFWDTAEKDPFWNSEDDVGTHSATTSGDRSLPAHVKSRVVT